MRLTFHFSFDVYYDPRIVFKVKEDAVFSSIRLPLPYHHRRMHCGEMGMVWSKLYKSRSTSLPSSEPDAPNTNDSTRAKQLGLGQGWKATGDVSDVVNDHSRKGFVPTLIEIGQSWLSTAISPTVKGLIFPSNDNSPSH